ncbi:MAG: UDP-3-O-(3-hydroxymyristoyl)glucosamine N-acyltransferase [Saprospiraceae bacterium]
MFYLREMHISAQELANIIEGVVEGDALTSVNSPAKIEEAVGGQFTFLGNAKYEPYIYKTKASIVLVSEDFIPKQVLTTTLIRVSNVYVALSKLMDYFKQGLSYVIEVSELAKVDDSVLIGSSSSIGEFCIVKKGVNIGSNCILHGQNFIGDNVKIGNNVIIYPGVKVYQNCQIGDNCIIHANAVIGSDGFGFAAVSGDYNKISQIGNVVIGNNVEIGANTVIDRATMGSTIIKDGVKLDNLIQVGHNVLIGNNTVIAAQTGIAGSTKIGENCIIGGQVGFMGHIDVAPGVMIQAKSGIGSNVKEPNSKLYGYPAMDYQAYLKSYAYFKKLPDIVAQMRSIAKELDMLKQEL